jgi:hypothetical protein
LFQAGKHTFTLPICLRRPTDPGYPPSDEQVYEYFNIPRDNDLSFSAHRAIASFIGAAHATMLKHLKRMQAEGLVGQRLLDRWHLMMEHQSERKERRKFFDEVIKLAKVM